VIVALSVWALRTPADNAKTARIGSDPNAAKTASANVKHVIRFNPGALYLPGLVPENATKPIEGIAKVGEAFEKMFPDTRLEFIGIPGDSREWIVTQLSSGQAPDVIQINVEDVWQDIQKNWYVSLDDWLEKPNPFVKAGEPGSVKWWDMFKYPIPTRGTAAPDGKMYCIVLDMIETGIFYNKTLFDRLRLREPKDWTEFLELQKTLKQNGYIPMLVDRQALSDWGVDLVFEQLYGELRDLLDVDYDPRRGEYLHGYLDWDEIIFLHKKGFFTAKDPRWMEMWKILREWRAYMAADLNPIGTDFFRSFVTQKGAMLWGHSMNVTRLVGDPDRAFDWGIFYLPPMTQSYNRFARGKDMCVIGGSAMQYCVTNSSYKDTGDPKTSERLQRVMAFLQFLTTPENCNAVVNERVALLPNIKGVEPHPELRPFHEFLQRHYSMTKWFYTFDLQFDEVLLRMLELFMNDGMTQRDFVEWMEKNLDNASKRIIRRKDLDIGRFQAVWDQRREMRQKLPELPNDAK
jgi:raffinose/stachyose/melibiose transport system substrate-binding protein